MKRLKLFALYALSFVMIFCTLCACSDTAAEEDNTVLSLSQANVSKGLAEYSVMAVKRTDFITTKHPVTYLSYYELDDENCEYLDIFVSLKNISDEKINAEKLLKLSVEIGESTYKTDCIPEILEGTAFFADGTMPVAPKQSIDVHYFVRLEKNLLDGDLTVKATSGKNVRTAVISRKEIISDKVKSLTKGDSFKTDSCSVTVKSFDSAARYQPEKAGKEFKYYEVSQEGNILFIMNTEIVNSSDKKVCADSVMAACVKVGCQRYFGTSVIENEEKTDFVVPAKYFIEPGESVMVSYIMDVPFSAVEKGATVEIFSHGLRYCINY